ncbi:MAG: helix-turn-helix domain-containing protein [Ruminococcus sp.]|nr:helix-turn-helix domain-containing protein [Ruminococcus sp.]
MMNQTVFGKNLARIRKSVGMTQEQLAQKMKVSPQAVSKWEKTSYPDGELLPRLAKTLNTSLDVLFGLKEKDEEIDLEQLITDEIHRTAPEERCDLMMKMFYSALCAYNNYTVTKMTLPERLDLETYAELKTNQEIALARLNDDLRYFCFLDVPKRGLNSYIKADQNENMVRLFRMLSDEDTLKIIYYLGSGARNRMHSKEVISERLGMPIESVSRSMDRLDRFGLVWRVSAEITNNPMILYGYTYSLPLTMILTLAKSLTNYISFREPFIDQWTQGAFHSPGGSSDAPIPQVSVWEHDEPQV